MDKDSIKVSIVCFTYNHENYIAEALEGFIMQKTDFDYEIIVHDDASTDNTQCIVKQYEEKYPNIIFPIYQKENVYAKPGHIGQEMVYKKVRGDYIAFCEGDDFWTDPYKLQKQFDAMEKHPEIDICAHCATVYDDRRKKYKGKFGPCLKRPISIISLDDVIMGGGGFVATNSLFFRSSLEKNRPEFYEKFRLDYVKQIHGATRGGMLYLKDNMSVYRTGVAGSWTTRINEQGADALKSHRERVIQMLNEFDEYTENRHHDAVKKSIEKIRMDILVSEKKYSEVIHNEYYKETYSMGVRLKINIKKMLGI